MNFFRQVELKLNYSAAANFEKPEKVHKARKNRPKTGGFMVVGCMAEVRVAPANTLEILHFYGIDARVYYEKAIRLCIAQGRICLFVIWDSEIVQKLLKSVLCS